MDSGAVQMVRYIDRSTTDTPNPGADFFKFVFTPQVGWFKFLMMACSATQWLRNTVHYAWPVGPRYALSYGQASLSSAVERFNDANSTQILSVLSVIPQFVSTFKIYLYQ